MKKKGTQQKETKHAQPDSSQNQKSLLAAARRGDLALVQSLMAPERGAQRVSPNADTLLAAVKSGNLALVQWLVMGTPKGERVEPTVLTLLGAATAGHLPLVQWLMKEAPQGVRVSPSVGFLEFLSDLGKLKAFSEEIKQWFEQALQTKKTMTSSSSTSTAEKKERETKHAQPSPPQKLQDRFPTAVINKEILSCLPTQDILSFAGTMHSADQLVTESKVLVERIKSKFKLNIQTLITLMPASRQPLLLPHARIYRHLTAWSKLDSQTRNRYTLDDPTVFQRTLSADVVELPLWYDYLGKAARVGNLALMQWLMTPARLPANCQPLLLPHTHVYRHFSVLNKLDSQTRNRYAIDDPALFQRALSADVVELPLLYDYLDKAAKVGNLALVQWLMAPERGAQRVNPDVETLRGAAWSGDLAVVQWLMAAERGEQCVDPDVETLRCATESGSLALVQWLMAPERGAQRVNPDIVTLRCATESGNLALVQWLMAPERGTQRVNPNAEMLRYAAGSGNLALVQWLMAPERGAQRVDPDGSTLREAAQSGNLALVQWLMAAECGAQRLNPDDWTLCHAAQSGNLALVQWLMAPERGAQRVNPDGETLHGAIWSGNLALVQWLMAPERGEQRVDPDGETLGSAARSGNLALVQWLMAVERGVQRVNPDVETLCNAARSGNVALVQWLMAPARGEQCVDPDVETLRSAAESGNLALVQWLMAPARGAQRVEPSLALLAEVREKGFISGPIKLWFEQQALQSKNSQTAVPLSTPSISQQLPRAESKTPTQSANSADSKGILSSTSLESNANASHQVSSQSSIAGKDSASTGFSSTSTTTSSSITTNTPHQAGEQKETKQTQQSSSRKEVAPSFAATTNPADELAPFQKASDVTEYLRLHDELDKAARAGNLALVQQLMMAPARGAQRVSPSVETLSYAAQSGNLELVQWLMAPERGAQRVAPDADTLRSAVMSKNLALVQWLMAPERGEERVDPSPELIFEVKGGKLGNPAIKQWFEKSFPPQKTPVASSVLTQHAKNRTQQPLSSESKPFYPARLSESKGISVFDSKRPVAGGVQTSSSSTSMTAFSSAVVKTGGSPLHNMGGQQTTAASSQQSRTNAGSQAGQGVTGSSLNGTGSNRLKDSQLKSPGKQGK
jgi:hypothetical protein